MLTQPQQCISLICHTYCYLLKVTGFLFVFLKWSSHMVTNIYQPPSQSPNVSKHSLCLWGGSAASDLCEERFDCDRKRGLSTAGTWMTASEREWGLKRKHLTVADISMTITGQLMMPSNNQAVHAARVALVETFHWLFYLHSFRI